MDPVTVGIDIGQKHDPTAIVVTEVGWRDVEALGRHHRESVFTARFLQRLPLGMPYPDVAHRLVGLVLKLRAMNPQHAPRLMVDATGVGAPVVDILRRDLAGICSLTAVTFNSTDRFERPQRSALDARLGKGYLVSRLQALLQTRRIRLPDNSDEARALEKELRDYEIRVDEAAHMTAGAMKTGTHDDLVTALGLAVLEDVYVSSWTPDPSERRPKGIMDGIMTMDW